MPEGWTRTNTASSTAIAILRRTAPARFRINGLSRQDILGAKDGLFCFDAETPCEQQARWELNIPRDPEYDEADDGVIRKTGVDQKIYLHWRPDLEQLLAERGIELTPHEKEWFPYCERIHTACRTSLLELARKMDTFSSGYRFTERVEKAWDQHVLRILKYEPRRGVLARCHTDRCAVTFHIAESSGGLVVRQGDDMASCNTPHSPEVLCFTGTQLESITEGLVPRLHHKVVDTTGGEQPRWAMVFFGKMLKDPGMF